MYVVVDIETTGGNKHSGKITEIAAILYDGTKVVDRFVTLVNPERPIDKFVSRLTGITDAMVADAPLFEEIADDFDRFTANAIFVAHNVNFDYPFIREEYRRIGKDYSRRRLCTVRLSRRTFPDLPSYSLDKITGELSLHFNGHHRAEADAMATVRLFEKILEKHSQTGLFDVNFGVSEIRDIDSPYLDREFFKSTPDDAGIYNIYDREDRLIYTKGSAHILTDLMERLLRRDTESDRKLQKLAYRVDWMETGSVVGAKLMEANSVLKDNPEFNRGRLGMNARYGLFASDEEPEGTLLFKKRTSREVHPPIMVFPSYKEGHEFFVKRIAELGFGHFREGGRNQPLRLSMSIEEWERFLPDGNYLVLDEGRRSTEASMLFVKDGVPTGLDHGDVNGDPASLSMNFPKYPFGAYPELQMILAKYIAKKRYDRIVQLP